MGWTYRLVSPRQVSRSCVVVLPRGEGAAVVLPEDPMPGRAPRRLPGRLLVPLGGRPQRRRSTARGTRARSSSARSSPGTRPRPSGPPNPTDPFDPAYQLDDVDELARNAQQRGIELLITIWGTPAWANGGQKPNRPPTDPADLEDFAQALADRYSGRHAGYPAVRLFSAWNEPNLEQFLAPQFDEVGRSVGPSCTRRSPARSTTG